jgi:sulfate permease, SulP family
MSDAPGGHAIATKKRGLPIFKSFDGYNKKWIRGDVIAGLTVWAVLIPEALAYATIAGVSPVIGLYAAPPALLFYAMFGSSKHLIVGPMSATAALSAAAVADLTTDNPIAFTAMLALVTGILALLAGVLRLGFLANFISEPVLKGFIIGLALTIIMGQLPKLFGVEKEPGNFFEQLRHFVGSLDETEWRTLTVGLVSLAIVLGLKRWAPAIPGSLVAVVVGILAVNLFDLASKGVAIVGEIDSGLPSIGLPQGVGYSDYFQAAASAAGIMLVGFAEGLGAAKTYAAKAHYDIDPNRELIGLGVANLGSGLCSGMVVNGSLSKTAVNGGAGARSQLSGIVVAVLTIVTLLFLTGLFEDLPEPTLAAVVIAAVIELVDIGALVQFRRLYTSRLGKIYGEAARPDFIAAIAAMLGVLIFDTLPGLFIGITVSILLLLFRASKPHIAELGQVPGSSDQYSDLNQHPDNTSFDGIVVLRVESGLFFANSDAVRDSVREHAKRPGTRAVVIDAEVISFVDATALQMLAELADDLARSSVQLSIAHGLGQVRDLLGTDAQIGSIRLFPTVRDALDALVLSDN